MLVDIIRLGYYRQLYVTTFLYVMLNDTIETILMNYYTGRAKKGRHIKDLYFPLLVGGVVISTIIICLTPLESFVIKSHVLALEAFCGRTGPPRLPMLIEIAATLQRCFYISIFTLVLKGGVLLISRRAFMVFSNIFEQTQRVLNEETP